MPRALVRRSVPVAQRQSRSRNAHPRSLECRPTKLFVGILESLRRRLTASRANRNTSFHVKLSRAGALHPKPLRESKRKVLALAIARRCLSLLSTLFHRCLLGFDEYKETRQSIRVSVVLSL